MAQDLFTQEVTYTRKWKQRCWRIEISNPINGLKSVFFQEEMVPFDGNEMKFDEKKTIGGFNVILDPVNDLPLLVEDISYTSPLDGQVKTIKVADLAESIAQFYLNKTGVKPPPI